jgi:acetaldehyde dehydrogenase/alcohol dehydrogenase
MKLCLCIPTTAGTGIDVSPVAVVYDEKNGVKKALPQSEITPAAALVNPLLHVRCFRSNISAFLQTCL